MNSPENLSLSELEKLAEAYLDCRLTLLEEKELEYLLLNSKASSPLIDEARESMEITSLLAASKSKRASKHVRIWPRLLRIVAAAACIAAVALTSVIWLRPAPQSESFYVCIDGRELSEEESRIRAKESEASSMALLNKLLAEAQIEKEQAQQIIETANKN